MDRKGYCNRKGDEAKREARNGRIARGAVRFHSRTRQEEKSPIHSSIRMPRPIDGRSSVDVVIAADARARAARPKSSTTKHAVRTQGELVSFLNAGSIQPPSMQVSDKAHAAANQPRVPKRAAIQFEELYSEPQPPADRTTTIEPPPLKKDGASIQSLASMSYEDLHEIYRLCGGREKEVTKLLAKFWATESTAIEPLVRSWFAAAAFPPFEPPSRHRSAPPALSPAMQRRLAATAKELGILIAPKVPAFSAPALSSSGPAAPLPAVLTALHEASARLAASSGRWRQHEERARDGADKSVQSLVLPQQPTFVPVLPAAADMAALPDEPPGKGSLLDMDPHDALAEFMNRQGPQYQHAAILPTAGAAWRAMNHGSQRMPLGHEPQRQVASIALSGAHGLSVAQRHALQIARSFS